MISAAERLSRVTTEYVPEEDRIRLAGVTGDSSIVVLWLTQRLVRRLVPVLTAWLEARSKDLLQQEVLHVMAQQRAAQTLEPSEPVLARDAATSWLATTVDVHRGQADLAVTFRDEEHRATVAFNQVQLRQWLVIIRNCHSAAEWHPDVWPEWMTEDQESRPVRGLMLQ